MPASQDAWAKPLAKTLVDLFRVDDLGYVRTGTPTYDPATGSVSGSETTYTAAGAVAVSGKVGEGTTGADLYIEVWMNTEYIGDLFPTTDDYLTYQGRKYNIVSVDPQYSGDTNYACKVRAES
jgi:hypothetical protein